MVALQASLQTTANRRVLIALAVSGLLHCLLIAVPFRGTHISGSVRGFVGMPAERELSIILPTKEIEIDHSGEVQSSLKTANVTDPADSASKAPPPPEVSDSSAELAVFPISSPLFWPSSQLDKHPKPKIQPILTFPELEFIAASGKLIIKLWIDEEGKVVSTEALDTDLPIIFTTIALSAFKSVLFSPGERNGLKVGSIMFVEVRYDN